MNIATTQAIPVQVQKEIAGTIIKQLGGKKFIAMTGAKNFMVGLNENGNVQASFDIMRNAAKVNRVRITLNDMDLYDIEFYNIPRMGIDVKLINETNGADCEQLQPIFTSITGLYTSL